MRSATLRIANETNFNIGFGAPKGAPNDYSERNMNLKRKGLLITVVFLLAVFLAAWLAMPSVSACAETDEPSTTIDTNYWFERIDVEIEVRRDKTFAVHETLKVGFIHGGQNTGIIRDIQRVSQTTHVIDGKERQGKNFFANLSNVEVTIDGEPARVTQGYYSNGEFFSVKMQKPDQSFFDATDQENKTGFHEFSLSYVYDMSDDKAKGYDDFTLDVLGYDMAYTRVFSAQITFPEGTDLSDTTFRTNRKAVWVPDQFDPNTGNGSENCSVRDNVIKMLAAPYSANRGYTVQVILPDGYFEVGGTTQFGYYWAFFAVAVLAVAGIAYFFSNYCSRKPLEVLEISPPEGMRAMRYSSIWHAGARAKDAAAVITQWADEGYVRIEQDGRKDLKLYKLKDLPETADEAERNYFHAVFPRAAGGDVFSTKEMRSTRSMGLNYRRSSQMHTRLNLLISAANDPDPRKKGNLKAHILMTALSLVPMLMTVVYFCILLRTALPIFFFIFMAAGTMVGSMQAREFQTPIAYIFPIAFMGMPFGVFFALFYLSLYDYAALLWIAIAVWAASLVLLHFMKRRSPEAQKELGSMRGFKRFLLTAELSRIEMLFRDDPDYYSHIIPYCLIMGISDKVAKRFKALDIAAPEWAQAATAVGFSSFARSLSSSSGGGSHGGGGGGHGGSSGGGGGGGGSRGC